MSSIRKAVFPVAGLGTRFLPLTKSLPKEMLPLVDRPIIHWAVAEAVSSGIEQMVLVTSHGKSIIEDYFDSAPELESLLEQKGKTSALESVIATRQLAKFASVRQHEALGLGHAVLTAREVVGDEPFAVLLCDDVLDAEVPCLRKMIEIHEKHKGSVLCVEKVPIEHSSSYGMVAGEQIDDRLWRLTDLVEKPAPENSPSDLRVIGRYVLSASIFDELETLPRGAGGEIQLTDAIKRLSAKEDVFAYVLEGRCFDVGSKLGFVTATVEQALKHPELGEPLRRHLKQTLGS